MTSTPNLNKKKAQRKINNFAKYSGLSFQMIAIVMAGLFGGIKLDEFAQLDFPLFTLVLSLLGVFLAIYIAIKDFIN